MSEIQILTIDGTERGLDDGVIDTFASRLRARCYARAITAMTPRAASGTG